MEPADVVRALFDSRQDGDWEVGLRYIAEESLDQGKLVTRDDWRRKWAQMFAACPDFSGTVENTMVDGEWVSNRYTMSGTPTGEFLGRQPTGERVMMGGMDQIRVRDGQIVEHWGFAGSI